MLHPRDVAGLITRQIHFSGRPESRLINVAGGAGQTMSLRQLSAWCAQRWGPRDILSDPQPRQFDLPWVALDSTRALDLWAWKPETAPGAILDEIARQAEADPGWLDLSAP
jgi:CDP-paratose 2-epimerase